VPVLVEHKQFLVHGKHDRQHAVVGIGEASHVGFADIVKGAGEFGWTANDGLGIARLRGLGLGRAGGCRPAVLALRGCLRTVRCALAFWRGLTWGTARRRLRGLA